MPFTAFGTPSGPGTLPFDYFAADPAKADWQGVPEAARAVFPSVDQIMVDKVVRLKL